MISTKHDVVMSGIIGGALSLSLVNCLRTVEGFNLSPGGFRGLRVNSAHLEAATQTENQPRRCAKCNRQRAWQFYRCSHPRSN